MAGVVMLEELDDVRHAVPVESLPRVRRIAHGNDSIRNICMSKSQV
jgi:hypothetical protein